MQTKSLETRWLIRRDMLEVLELERVKNASPWTEDDWLSYLCQRDHIGIVAETHNHEILGAMLYRLDFTGLEIVHLVAETNQAADALIARMKLKLGTRRTWLEAVVPESDLNSQLFFQQHGFVAYDFARGKFGDEDGYKMLYSSPAECLQ